MRIVSGDWRGRPLVAPEGGQTRPTSDRAREGLFSMLASRIGTFEGLHVADLFAGSGALGLEALSRGAAHCLFVDRERNAIDAIKANVERLGAKPRSEIRAQGVEHAPPPRQPCDLILMDPPYADGLAEATLKRIAAPDWLAPGGYISVETERPGAALPPGLTLETERRFGKAFILLLRSG